MPVSNPSWHGGKFVQRALGHHKDNYLLTGGFRACLFCCCSFFFRRSILLLFKFFKIEINEIFLSGQHIPDGDQDFTCDGHLDFHLIFLFEHSLCVTEIGEEAISGS